MPLLERLYDDMKAAMRSGDKDRLAVLRMTIAQIKKEAIDAGAALDEEAERAVVAKALKQRREAAEAFAKGGRPELAEKESREGEILAGYLPQQMSDDELAAAVREAIAESGASSPKDLGKVMGKLLARHRERVEGNRAREAVQRALGAS